ncbi:MAG: NFACT RNA binding domain-containing protein [Cyanobacteriota bacterium]|nr:NFACT RNA binding domain-containing protein [Cyanobacteriota bacterium]
MDLTSLQAVLSELRPALLPSRFEKAQQATPQSLQLGLRSLQGIHWLELSWLAEAPRLHAIAPPPRQGEGSTLAQQLQHGLRGLALVQLAQSGWERVVELGFARRPGDGIERTLVLELMGRHSNLFLLDAARQVISLARQVREQHSRLRPITTGDAYQPPPPLQGVPPSAAEPLAAWQHRLQLQPLPLGQALLRSYQGVSPALVSQLLSDPQDPSCDLPLALTPVQDLGPQHWQHLHGRWLHWLQAMEHQAFAYTARGSGYSCWLLPGHGAEPAVAALDKPPLTINQGLETYYGAALAQRQHQALQSQWQQRLQQLLQREQRLLEEQQRRLVAGAQADVLQQQADALLCQANPERAVIEQAQGLYRKARRLRRSGAAIAERIAVHQQRQAWLETSLTFVEQAETLAALQPLLQDLATALERASAGRGRRQASRPAGGGERPQPLELTSPAGLRLQVGRNHRQNEWIALRQARRGDLWFHAQECPGSHVVLKASEGVHGEADLAAAAHLAAYFSRARGNGRVPVVMVETAALQRIPGAQPGTVRHSGGTVIWGVPAEAVHILEPAPSLPGETGP